MSIRFAKKIADYASLAAPLLDKNHFSKRTNSDVQSVIVISVIYLANSKRGLIITKPKKVRLLKFKF